MRLGAGVNGTLFNYSGLKVLESVPLGINHPGRTGMLTKPQSVKGRQIQQAVFIGDVE